MLKVTRAQRTQIARDEVIRELRAQIANLELEVKRGLKREKELREKLHVEQLLRVSAQNGLTPYVYAIQAFNEWLIQRPHLTADLMPILKELGLYGVKVGYDPNKDLALSVISAKRYSA